MLTHLNVECAQFCLSKSEKLCFIFGKWKELADNTSIILTVFFLETFTHRVDFENYGT